MSTDYRSKKGGQVVDPEVFTEAEPGRISENSTGREWQRPELRKYDAKIHTLANLYISHPEGGGNYS